jgi:hypothetical protein
MKLLYDIINERALEAFDWEDHAISSDTFRKWGSLWIFEAKKLKAEFKAEGLHDTANALQQIIDDQKEILPRVTVGQIEERKR